MKERERPVRFLKPDRSIALVGLGIASAVGYAVIARLAGAVGFPLDDAWIHQTYARNLAWHGQWAFVLGQPSAGSTSPLWTALVAIGYFLRIDYALWTLALNAILLGLTAWLACRIVEQFAKLPHGWWVGVLIAMEWHLAWAAASGMETVLFCALVLAAWWAVGARWPHLSGVLIGLAVWTRPDGLTLLPFVALAIWLKGGRLKPLMLFVAGVAAVIAPYFLFNFALSGQVWPNTFFAKQAEYAILRERPLWQRLAEICFTPFIGMLILLWPGMLTRDRRRLLMLGWAATFLFTYVLRLPVTYQHGRYLIPAIPVLATVGGAGLASWVQAAAATTMWRRVISRAWVIGVGILAIAFWGLGAKALIDDIRIINGEMVATAKWVAANVPAGTLVAAHDIGALGYFAEVKLVDLAGLVSPEVISYMGDDERLWSFIQISGAEYFVNYPGWCPAFMQDARLKRLFETGPLCDDDSLHMAVFLLEQR